MAVALGLLVISLDLDLLRFVTRAIGAWTASSTLFFLGEVFLLIICLNFAVRLSQASLQIKTLGQELALLRAQLQDRRVSESIVSPRP
jgi:Tfp pilus assembly protein PilO